MKCAAIHCCCPELSVVSPCCVCRKGVHHLCSKDVYADATLEKRFCSTDCLHQYLGPPPPVGQDITVKETGASAVSAVNNLRSTPPASRHPNDSCGTNATSPSALPEYDTHGVPVYVEHHSRPNARDAVWSIIHDLAKLYKQSRGRSQSSFTSVCLLCTADSQPASSPSHWEVGLLRCSNTSNAKVHVRTMHPDHPLGKEKINKIGNRAKKRLSDLISRQQPSKRVKAKEAGPKTRAGPLKMLWCPTDKAINTAVSNWLVSDGLPYNLVTSEAFRSCLRFVTDKEQLTILSPSTHNDLLNASYDRYTTLTNRFLHDEFQRLNGQAFLTLMHDTYTSCGKKGVIGAFVNFLDHNWRMHHISLLVAVKNDSHAAEEVKRVIVNGCQERYGIDIGAMAKFSVSDTAPVARKISKEFDATLPTDCHMHILSLCLSYGLGLRESVRTGYVVDPVTKQMEKQKLVVTEGGALPEGSKVIRKLRRLNNYFSTPQRADRLESLQKYLKLPVLSKLLDVDVRVASASSLMQRSIVNFPAFRAYFQSPEPSDDPSVFTALSDEDWRLVVELDGITNAVAHLALMEIQREHLLASEAIMLIKFAANRLSANKFRCYDLQSGRTSLTNEKNLPRLEIAKEDMLGGAQTCIARISAQLRQQAPALTPEHVMPILLDPRTKSAVQSILSCSSYDDSFRDQIIQQAETLFQNELRKLFKLKRTHENGCDKIPIPVTSRDLRRTTCDEDEFVICGDPLETHEEMCEGNYLTQADQN